MVRSQDTRPPFQHYFSIIFISDPNMFFFKVSVLLGKDVVFIAPAFPLSTIIHPLMHMEAS